MDVTLKYQGVSVEISRGDYLVDGKPTPECVKFYQSLVNRLEEFRLYAATKLLDLYNNVWVDDGEGEDEDYEPIGKVDTVGFISRLTNPSVVIYDEIDYAIIYFEDGGLFAGHAISVSVDGEGPINANICG